MQKNAEILATYALTCQKVGIVPIVEPEVLGSGDHTDEECFNVTEKVLKVVFDALEKKKVDLRFVLLKPNMVVPGSDSRQKMVPEKVANLTVSCLKAVVPKIVPGIVFLSGGQTEEEACENLNAIAIHDQMPWVATYSYGRALQNSTLEKWGGDAGNIKDAQKIFLKRAKLASLAQQAKYTKSLEK